MSGKAQREAAEVTYVGVFQPLILTMKTHHKRFLIASRLGGVFGKISRYANTVLIALLITSTIPAHTIFAQETPPVTYTFQECDQIEEARLRDELNSITQSIFEPEKIRLEIEAIVDRKWAELDLDSTVDAAVDAAVEKARSETDWWERVKSNWSADTTKELTEKVATYAFGSDSFANAVNLLSEDIASELLDELRVMTAKSASSALQCVQAFIGDTFSQTMAAVLDEHIQERIDEIVVDPDPESATILDILELHPELLSGVAVIVGTQLAKQFAAKMAQNIAGKIVVRILGKLATSAIPLVGWIIGGGLIVWDVINAGEGAFPQIRAALQEDQTKAELRKQIASEVHEELLAELDLTELSRSVSNDVYSQWQGFRSKYGRVLELAETNSRFQGLLDDTPVEDVKKLADFVSVVEAKLGSERLESLLDKGQFERLLALPQEVLEMLELGVDPDVVIEWANLAGESVVLLVATELYRVASPSDFRDRADLERVLVLDDAELIQKAMLLEREERGAVLALPTVHIKQVLEALSPDELSWLAKAYLTKLNAQERNVLVDRILREPKLITELGVEFVQVTLLKSQDLEETLDYIALKTRDRLWVSQVFDMLSSIRPALSGELSWSLFWHYEGPILRNSLYLLAGLIVLAIFWSRIRSRRQRQDVNVTLVLPEGSVGSGSDADSQDREGKRDGESGQ
ncbi:MAG: hypothetical protein F4Z82_08195 [Caldilineaceae bacterium SB0668_bin_21]|nr:hypothetical protein [Caldilineaceae bacterium SB0668_bin_21]MYC20859.1 hypothetical protein [Caldilineaceae bacterium SB0662_bin_25]